MCLYLKLFAATIEVVNETAAESNATIQLRSGNFTSNLTITYQPCSGASSTTWFRPPVVHLVNLTADITYCYSITYNGNSATQVAGSCNGIFHTTADTTAHTPSTTGSMNRELHDVQRSVQITSNNKKRHAFRDSDMRN